MILRRIAYTAALLGAVVFYWAYREWLSWLFLLLLLLLPLFSLAMSLPAMLSCSGQIRCPAAVEQGAQAQLHWHSRSLFPLPAPTGRLRIRNTLTGEKTRRSSDDLLPTDHCGLLRITLHRPRCHDYLGLFSLPIRGAQPQRVLVRPRALAPAQLPDLSRFQVTAWRPKAGGGFSENHELRLYRPGDNLRQIHWKLSAKTGKLIIREPMEPVRNSMLLTLSLEGDAAQLDTKLGRLLWMSRHLLQKDLPHQIACHTGSGLALFDINCPEDLSRSVDALLAATPAAEACGSYPTAFWRYHIGGDAHE